MMHEGAATVPRDRIDAVHSILADGERRSIIRTLSAAGTPMSVSTLVDRVAEDRDETPVRVRLYHQHLPKMDDAEIVEYDRDAGRVVLTSTGRRADAVATRTTELLGGDPLFSE